MSVEEESTTNINVQSVNIPPPPEFNPDSEVGASLATRWITWMEDFEMFLTASGIKDETQKRIQQLVSHLHSYCSIVQLKGNYLLVNLHRSTRTNE
jgi:hypothetical protein